MLLALTTRNTCTLEDAGCALRVRDTICLLALTLYGSGFKCAHRNRFDQFAICIPATLWNPILEHSCNRSTTTFPCHLSRTCMIHTAIAHIIHLRILLYFLLSPYVQLQIPCTNKTASCIISTLPSCIHLLPAASIKIRVFPY